MPGVLAAAAYIPRYRLPRELIAREWGGQAAGGEKAVANHDEDSLTLAVSAALALEGAGERPDGLFFATTTSPYTEKQGAATIAAVLDLPSATRTADFTDTLRAGTSAFLAGLDTLAGARGACWSPRVSAAWASPTRSSSRTTAMPARRCSSAATQGGPR